MNILIIGGSGVLSSDFTCKCLDERNTVYVLNRGKRKDFLDSRAELILADWRSERIIQLKEKLRPYQFDVVVDFLTFNPEQMQKTLEVLKGRQFQYVFISSATAYKKTDENEIITEDTPLGNDKWDYAYNKFLCEEYLSRLNICYTIIRPYVTYGKNRIPFPIIPDGYHYTLLARIKEEKPVLLYNGGEAICTLTSTIDFARILYALLMNEKAYGQAFHITSNNQQTWKDVYMTLCEILGKEANMISVTDEHIKRFMLGFYGILRGDKGTNMRFDNKKVLLAAGGTSFISLADGLKQSVDFYESNEYMQGIDYKWDGRCDYLIQRVTGERLKCLSSGIQQYSNNKKNYYIQSIQPMRGIYDFARWVIRSIK